MSENEKPPVRGFVLLFGFLGGLTFLAGISGLASGDTSGDALAYVFHGTIHLLGSYGIAKYKRWGRVLGIILSVPVIALLFIGINMIKLLMSKPYKDAFDEPGFL